ncbi:hypothetical protein D0Y65_048761, partial [Glycine soja]
ISSSLSSNDLSLSSNESSSDDDDHFTRSKVLMLVVANVTSYFMNYVVKNPCRHSSMTSHHWVYEILNGHPIRCYQMFRTKKLIFLELCWEGSAHDTKIFMEALRKPALHFPHPPQGKYYLLDSSYPTFMGFLGPNKKTRYHLPQFKIGPRIRGRVEFFNYYHSSLRSTIEHEFGLCKERWKMMQSYPPRALDRRLQEDWAKDAREGPMVLMSLRISELFYSTKFRALLSLSLHSSPSSSKLLSMASYGGELLLDSSSP